MSKPSARAPRLFVDAALSAGALLPLSRDQASYLLTVLRLRGGDPVLLFNGRDGEWAAEVSRADRKGAELAVTEQTRPQPAAGDLHYLFAPLKHARLDYMVQKAVEMGASALRPVITRRTQSTRVNAERMQANMVEAAEQCGVLAVPELLPESSLETMLAGWDPARRLVFCDEDAPLADPLAALTAAGPGPLAILIGPEGGFDPAERAALTRLPGVIRLSLGPRVLRADTAAVAALAVVQAVLGDWSKSTAV